MRSLHGTAARLFGLALVTAFPVASIVFAGCTFDTPGAGSPSISDEAGLLDSGSLGPVDAKADARDAANSVQDTSIAADAGADASAPDTSLPDVGTPDAGSHDAGKSDAPHDAADSG
jgi:hypothetical protein